MIQQTDYSSLFQENPNYFPSWEQFYDYSRSYPENILELCRQVSLLPFDFYKIIAAYFLIPSALARRVPYLFFYGVSGSGKSTLGKLASHIHGIIPTSSNTTYAAIRNALRDNKFTWIVIESDKEGYPPISKRVEANIFMVWEDIDNTTFKKHPQTYALFKFGYDKATDTIQISGENRGTNETFRCFSPKCFSSIHPIHAIEDYKELQRRLIVIPTKKIDSTDVSLLDIDNINWKGFSNKFCEFWDLEQAEIWLTIRQSLSNIKGLTSHQKAISLDLITTGITTGLWSDENEAVNDLKECFDWIKKDIKTEATPLEKLITSHLKELEKNAKEVQTVPCIYNQQLRNLLDAWYQQGFLLNKPNSKQIVEIMRKHSYKTNDRGQWVKQLA